MNTSPHLASMSIGVKLLTAEENLESSRKNKQHILYREVTTDERALSRNAGRHKTAMAASK